jgi:periplasmic divalent cation tolerance protein
MARFIQVVTTTPNKKSAQKIARLLLKKHLAGCVQIFGPIQSSYWWKGRVETAREWLCLIKTTRGLYKKTEKVILGIHPYKTPEILATPIITGSKDYLAWLGKTLS